MVSLYVTTDLKTAPQMEQLKGKWATWASTQATGHQRLHNTMLH